MAVIQRQFKKARTELFVRQHELPSPEPQVFEMEQRQNVTSLDSFRRRKEESERKLALKEYLSVLSFNELLTESNDIIQELNNNPLDTDLSHRSTLILKEFHDRIRESKNLEFTLGGLCQETEERLNEIQERL